jgi:hypothetical protein
VDKGGIIVLDASTEAETLYAEGAYKLSDEMQIARHGPRSSGRDKCSLKFKAWVIESWLKQNVYSPIRHTFGITPTNSGQALGQLCRLQKA